MIIFRLSAYDRFVDVAVVIFLLEASYEGQVKDILLLIKHCTRVLKRFFKSAYVDPCKNKVSSSGSRRTTMPVDFQSYLLSSSPPGFGLEAAYSSDHFFKQNGLNHFKSAQLRFQTKAPSWLQEHQSSSSSPVNAENVSSMSAKNAERILSWEQSYNDLSVRNDVCSLPTRSKSEAKMGKKKVSFADDIGLELEIVRLMTESSDMPPTLEPDAIAHLDIGSSSFSMEPISYVFNFPQPFSDYLVLRNKMESNKVSLESVSATSCSIFGKIRVKNIAFEKKVFVRFTKNNWTTYTDILASYVPVTGDAIALGYETFAFDVSVPAGAIEACKMQFAVCYEVGSQQFWDNNNGENYEIISVAQEIDNNSSGRSDQAVFSLNHDDSWTDFSVWGGIESHDPYW